MGTVTFNTDITKTVDIAKTVNLTVDKTVISTVELTGSLATAEASAVALGGAGNLAVSYVVDESGSIIPADFDTEIAAVRASIDDLRTQFPEGGDVTVMVQIVGFSDGAESATFDLHDDVLDDVATGTPLEVQAAGLTNFEAGLDEAVDFFAGAGADSGVMIFLSDGAATAGGRSSTRWMSWKRSA